MEVLAEALAREPLWDLLQARGTGWVRAVRVAAPLGGRVRQLTAARRLASGRQGSAPERRDLESRLLYELPTRPVVDWVNQS